MISFEPAQGVLENNDINDQVMQCMNEGVAVISTYGEIVNVNRSATLIFGVSTRCTSPLWCRRRAKTSSDDI